MHKKLLAIQTLSGTRRGPADHPQTTVVTRLEADQLRLSVGIWIRSKFM